MEAERFREALNALGITRQVDAAAAFGVNQTTISKWLLGKRRIPTSVALLIDRLPKKRGRKAKAVAA